jgi:hypothetical protein
VPLAAMAATAAHAVGPVVAIERVNVSGSGVQAAGTSFHAALSADGRFVAFDTGAVISDASAESPSSSSPLGFPVNVYVRDRVTGTTTLVSVGAGGVEANGFSNCPSISADGRYVAFSSTAGNLVAGDTNGTSDVFVRDRVLGTTVRASVVGDGPDTAGGGQSDNQLPNWMSADGRYVVFNSYAKLTANATNGQSHVFRRDLATNTTALVDATPGGVGGDHGSTGSSMSSDGRYVVFKSGATDLVAGANPWLTDHLYVRDVLGGVTSLTPNLCPNYTGQSGTFHLSRNARYATFESYCTDIAVGQDPADRLFVRDLAAGVTTPLRLNDNGAPGADGAFMSISNSGRYAVAWSQAANIVAGDTDVYADVFLRDIAAGRTYRITQRADDGAAANQSSYSPMIGSGGHVLFASDATNLVDGDTNGARDIFVATLDAMYAAGFE